MKVETGELLRAVIKSTCINCKREYQINKEAGKIDYVCPYCKTDNWKGK